MVDLKVKIKNLILKNPVITASGTSGYGEELSDFMDIAKLGGIIVKGTTLYPREGNDYPRMMETPSGMLNAVGLQNKGVDYFINNTYQRIKDFDTSFLVNVNGSTIEEYIKVAEKINELDKIPAIELNISCPNVKNGGMSFGVDPNLAEKVVSEVRKVYKKALIVKLSPNVTDISEIAKAVEIGGADAVSLVNTFVGMAINVKTRRPFLSTITGGLSGPAIKPIALRMVWQVSNAVKIPVIGLGGIMTASDALEFIIAGASAVEIGTALFVEPNSPLKIIKGIEDYMNSNNITNIQEISGSLQY